MVVIVKTPTPTQKNLSYHHDFYLCLSCRGVTLKGEGPCDSCVKELNKGEEIGDEYLPF